MTGGDGANAHYDPTSALRMTAQQTFIRNIQEIENEEAAGGEEDARKVSREREIGKMSRRMERGIKKGEKKTVKVRKRRSEEKMEEGAEHGRRRWREEKNE